MEDNFWDTFQTDRRKTENAIANQATISSLVI